MQNMCILNLCKLSIQVFVKCQNHKEGMWNLSFDVFLSQIHLLFLMFSLTNGEIVALNISMHKTRVWQGQVVTWTLSAKNCQYFDCEFSTKIHPCLQLYPHIGLCHQNFPKKLPDLQGCLQSRYRSKLSSNCCTYQVQTTRNLRFRYHKEIH